MTDNNGIYDYDEEEKKRDVAYFLEELGQTVLNINLEAKPPLTCYGSRGGLPEIAEHIALGYDDADISRPDRNENQTITFRSKDKAIDFLEEYIKAIQTGISKNSELSKEAKEAALLVTKYILDRLRKDHTYTFLGFGGKSKFNRDDKIEAAFNLLKAIVSKDKRDLDAELRNSKIPDYPISDGRLKDIASKVRELLRNEEKEKEASSNKYGPKAS